MKLSFERLKRGTQKVIKNDYDLETGESEFVEKEREYLAGMPLLTVGELSSFLELPPLKKVHKKHHPIDKEDAYKPVNKKISAFKGPEKDFLLGRENRKLSVGDYRNLRRRIRLFKERYDQSKKFEHTDTQLMKMATEWLYLYYPLGFVATDYFDFKLYERSIADSLTFVDFKYKKKIKQLCTEKGFEGLCENKPRFNERLKDFIHRDFLDVRKISFEEFEAFVDKHPTFFAKPIDGKSGKGAGIVNFKGDKRAFYNDYVEKKMLMEELLVQHEELAGFNPDAINTLRVMTLLPLEGDPIITFAGIRFGRKGMVVDNISGGGMTAAIDIETGKIMTKAIDKYDTEFASHPDTNKKFEGFQIPNWETVAKTAKDAAISLPEIRSIGWDFAILSDGTVELIEGNRAPNFRVAQISDQVGKKHLYEEHIEKIKLAKYGDVEIQYSIAKKPFINKRQVFTVEELCHFLEIEIPEDYVKYAANYVYRTRLFRLVENRKSLIADRVKKDEYSSVSYDNIKKLALYFKSKFHKCEDLKQTDANLCMHYLNWRHSFAHMGFGISDYFKLQLYTKTIEEAGSLVKK